MDFIDEVVQKAQKAGKYIAEKADTAVDYVSLEYKASSLRGKLDVQYKELGKLYYKLSETQAEDCGELQEHVDAVRALICELNAVEEDMSKYKNICPECKESNPAKAEYCSKCGTKLK